MIKEALSKVIERQDLTQQEMEAVFTEIMTGTATPAQISAFLVALRIKKETINEITAAAHVMRKFAAKINTAADITVIDTCGTGGDCIGTFNVSTISAFVVAGAGGCVAKHGNRSVSSSCGSADLLEKLGVNINVENEIVEKCINDIGIGFLFAPLLHQAMKYAMPARKEIGIRTIFNILGPLTNPAGAQHQLLGVFDEGLVEPLINVLQNLGLHHALVVHGKDGLDEVTVTCETKIAELHDKKIKSYYIKPEDFDIKRAQMKELLGGNTETNARIARDILDGERGPKRDIVVINAACALYAGDIAATIKEGIKLAETAIDSKKAKEALQTLIKYTNKK